MISSWLLAAVSRNEGKVVSYMKEQEQQARESTAAAGANDRIVGLVAPTAVAMV